MRNAARIVLIVVCGGILLSFLTGCGEKTVATVDGVKITQSEYYQRLEEQPAGRDPETQRPIEAGEAVLQQLINEKLLLLLAEKQGVPPTDEQVNERLQQLKKSTPDFDQKLKEIGITEEQLKREIKIQQAAFNLQTKGVKVTDQQIKEYYEKHKDTEFTEPESASVAAIFVKNKADADKAMKLLNEKASFETVARAYSLDKQSAAQGGVLSTPIVRQPDDNSEPIATIMKTKEGEITGPIPMGDGTYAIFKVLKYSPRRVKPLSEVEFAIREKLMTEAGRKRNPSISEQLQKFKKEIPIKVEIEKYKEFFNTKASDTTPLPGMEMPEEQ